MTPRISSETGIESRVLRDHFIRQANRGLLNAHIVALRLGWLDQKGTPDSNRVYRTLGMREQATSERKGGKRSFREHVEYDTAAQLCDAMDLDYHEVGL